MSSELEFNYKIFSINQSSKNREPNNFWIDCYLKPNLQLRYKNLIIIDFLIKDPPKSIEWYGDCLLCKLKSPFYIDFKIKIYCMFSCLILEISPEITQYLKIHDENFKNFSEVSQTNKLFYIFSFSKNNDVIPKSEDILNAISDRRKSIQKWLEDIPNTNRYISKEIWNFHWVLHRLNRFPHDFTNESNLVSSCWPYSKVLTPWESLHIIEDLMWFHSHLAKKQLIKLFNEYLKPDGLMENGMISEKSLSIPPIWSSVLLDYSKLSGDKKIISELYPLCKKNLEWWEKNRFIEPYNLFGAIHSVNDFGIETMMKSSPRFSQQFDGNLWNLKKPSENRSLLLIDLNSQMCEYYQNMGVLGLIMGDENSSSYFKKAEALQENAQKYFWDPKTQFYYDFDFETQLIQPMKTIAGFWALYGGIVSKVHIQPIMDHLINPDEFWSEFPVPTLALDEPFYSNEIWHGPALLSQNYWLLRGLKKFNLNRIVTEICYKIFRYLNYSFNLYGGIYKFYPPLSYNVNSIKIPKSDRCYGYDLGQSPLHSLFYRGLLGAEILDDSINFVPDWSVLNKEVNFSFYYRGKKIETYLSKMDKKMVTIEDRVEKMTINY
nr:trehalase family glycosidase [Candidatus Prometheoarchaeum syntrophicum]QEE17642.1 alpha-glucosidase [Candidatus Prometheoarchaeum syntrophicum]